MEKLSDDELKKRKQTLDQLFKIISQHAKSERIKEEKKKQAQESWPDDKNSSKSRPSHLSKPTSTDAPTNQDNKKRPRLFLLLLIIRLSAVFLVQSYHVPDEYYQSVEPAYKFVYENILDSSILDDHLDSQHPLALSDKSLPSRNIKLTWEWRKNVALRSPLHLFIMVFSFFLCSDRTVTWLVNHVDYIGGSLIFSTRVFHAYLTAWSDYRIYLFLRDKFKFYQNDYVIGLIKNQLSSKVPLEQLNFRQKHKIHHKNSLKYPNLNLHLANIFLYLSITNWFWYYNCSRTLVNCLEVVFNNLAITYFLESMDSFYAAYYQNRYFLNEKKLVKSTDFNKFFKNSNPMNIELPESDLDEATPEDLKIKFGDFLNVDSLKSQDFTNSEIHEIYQNYNPDLPNRPATIFDPADLWFWQRPKKWKLSGLKGHKLWIKEPKYLQRKYPFAIQPIQVKYFYKNCYLAPIYLLIVGVSTAMRITSVVPWVFLFVKECMVLFHTGDLIEKVQIKLRVP